MGDQMIESEPPKPMARMSLVEKARFRLRNGWRNDKGALNQYFQACVQNWKIYKGKRDPKMVMKLQCIYRQAMYGDNKAPPPENLKNIHGLRWAMWTGLKGMPEEMAKRRFITFLAEIDPMLIDVMADEKPPDGFCRDEADNIICAKCNTVAGCVRSTMDQFKIDLKDQLFDSEDLWETKKLRKWVNNALSNQQCVWGKHKPVAKIDIKQFQGWFDKEENGGFQAYDSVGGVVNLVKELLYFHYDLGYQMQINLKEYGAEKFNQQAVKVGKIQAVYEELSGEHFIYEAACRLNVPLCNERRAAEGGRNHTHPVILEPPSAKDADDYDSSIELRAQCARLGLKQTTGPVSNVQQRCEIYRKRIDDYHAGLEISSAATARLDARADKHAYEKDLVGGLSRTMINRQISDACHAMSVDHIIVLIRRGGDPNYETLRGLTPLLCAVLNLSSSEQIEDMIINLKCNVNHVNQYGMTPLMMACRMKDTKMIHVLMRNGVSALQTGGANGQERTAMHWCAVHGSEEEAKIIIEYVKEGGGDSLRLTRALDSVSSTGDTPLMLASRIRNGLMCRTLQGLGANPNIRNKQGRNAYNLSRNAGWNELADWLETKVGAGVAKIETYSDLQYDKKVRYGKVRMMEAVEQFARDYLSVVHVSTSTTPVGPPSVANTNVQLFGERAMKEQLALCDCHQAYIEGRDIHGEPYHPAEDDPKVETLKKMTVSLLEMLETIQNGGAAPNTECNAKPLGWTPLMCAVAISNVRVLKLLLRNGADPEHPNFQGTTALMLACQLNNRDCMLELMEQGADIRAVDNFGYTPLAYATSLPVPSHAKKSSVDAITEGGSSGEAKRDASDLIKYALTHGFKGLKKELEASAAKANDVVAQMDVSEQKRSIRLLERYGLSHVATEKQMLHALDSTRWRLVLQTTEKSQRQKDKEYKEEQRRLREEEEAALAAELAAIEASKPPPLRCPICTLMSPCAHFRSEETLRKFLDKNNIDSYSIDAGHTAMSDVGANLGMSGKALREMQKKEEGDKVLKEVGIYDRRFDRSVLFANKYRPREMELDRIDHERFLAMTAEADAEEDREDQLALEAAEAEAQQKAIADTPAGELAIEGGDAERAVDAGQEKRPATPEKKDDNSEFLTKASKAWTPKSALKVKSSYHDEGKLPGLPKPKELKFTEELEQGPSNPEYTDALVIFNDDEGTGAEGEYAPDVQVEIVPFLDSVRPKSPPEEDTAVVESKDGDGSEERKVEQYKEGSSEDDKSSDVNSYEAGRITTITSEAVLDLFAKEKQSDEEVAKREGGEDDDDENSPLTAEQKRAAFLAANFKKRSNNPFPPEERRLLKFTQNPIDAERHSVKQDKEKLTIAQVHEREKAERKRKRKNLPPPPAPPLPQITAAPPMMLSGWLFLPLSDTEDSPLVESYEVTMETWSQVVEHLWNVFLKDWSLRLVHHAIPKPSDLKTYPRRCNVCHVGFVRLRPSKKRTDIAEGLNNMCLGCLTRREMHGVIVKLEPTVFPKEAQEWPFMYRNPQSRAHQEKKIATDMSSVDQGIKLPALGQPSTELALLVSGGMQLPRPTSPTRSQFMDELDAHEDAMLRLRDGSMTDSLDTGSVGSIGSMGSLSIGSTKPTKTSKLLAGVKKSTGKTTLGNFDNMSVETPAPSLSAVSIPSVFTHDTADRIDKVATGNGKAPETLLIPFLLAKGLFNEVERGARMMLGLKTVNEGEGIMNLVKAFTMLAELYKNMGLWPLALATYMDNMDSTILFLGYQQTQSYNGLRYIVGCMLKMRCIPLAKEYTETLCRRIEQETLTENNFKSAQFYYEADKATRKSLAKHEDLWKKKIQPSIEEFPHHPSRNYNYVLNKVCGVPGMYMMYMGRDGYSLVAKYAFETYCMRFDKEHYGKYAQFVNLCLRLRDATDDELFRQIAQIMVQKYLARSLASVSPIAMMYRQVTSEEQLKAVATYMHHGVPPIAATAFDSILMHCLEELAPQYLLFYLRDGAAGYRNNNIKRTAEAFNAIVTRLQCFVRVYIGKEVVRRKREEREEAKRLERQRYLEEHGSSSEEDSDDDSDEDDSDED